MKPRVRELFNLTGLTVCLSLGAFSGHKAYAFEEELFDELPAVVSASRLTQSVLHSPSSVTVLDKSMIEASGFNEIADLFRLVPGFQVAKVDGRIYAVTYHGGGWEYPNRLQVLINGRSTYLPSLSTVDWNTLGLHIKDIDRIEVVRGPSASAYGSNSFSAAINIITIAPELDHNYQVYSRIGSDGDKDATFRISDELNQLHYRITGSYRSYDGYDDYDDSREVGSLAFHARTSINNADTLDIMFDVSDGQTDEDHSDYLVPADRDVSAWSGQLKWHHLISDDNDLTVSLSHIAHSSDDMRISHPLSDIFGLTPEQFEGLTGYPDQRILAGTQSHLSRKTDLELSYSQTSASGLQYVLGLGTKYETLKSPAYFPMKGTVSDSGFRIFGNAQLPLVNRLIGNLGVLYEDSQHTSGHWSPRASINWQFSDSQSLRFTYAQAHRLPSLLEQNFDVQTRLDSGFVIDERYTSAGNIDAEKIESFEIGLTGQHASLPIQWDLKLYKENISDTIGYVKDKTTNDFIGDYGRLVVNNGSYRAHGVEGELSFRPSAKSFIRLHFNHGEGDSKQIVTSGLTPEYKLANAAPMNSFGLLGAYQTQGWQFSLGAYYVGGFEWLSRGTYVDSYTRIDLGVSKTLQLTDKQNLTIRLAGQNIVEDYAEFNRELITEPHFFLSLELSEF